LLKAFHNLGMWLTKLHLMQEISQQSTVLGRRTRSFEGQDEAYDNLHFADDEVSSELPYINFK